jgi:U3 small nucleolar RNA-associated protein 21
VHPLLLHCQSFDGTIRVWDVPTGTCIDWLSFESPPTSLTISPTGEFLVTSHSDSVGLSVWCDKSFFHQVFLDGTPPLKPTNMQRPRPMTEEAGSRDQEEEARFMEKSFLEQKEFSVSVTKGDAHSNVGGAIHPKADGLVTLSGLPPGHWKNLFHLELIKERNKPREPPKKPPSAPFFLQWREGEKLNDLEGGEKSMKNSGKEISGEDVWNAVWSDDDDVESNMPKNGEEGKEGDKPTKLSSRKRGKSYLRSKLADILLNCHESKLGFAPVTDFFSELGPSAIDIELTELCHGEQDEEGMELLLLASSWLLEACQSKRSFEAINAYLNRFLYLHSNTIAGIETFSSHVQQDLDSEDRDRVGERKSLRNDVLQCVESLRLAQREAANSVRAKMQNALCLLHNFSLLV